MSIGCKCTWSCWLNYRYIIGSGLCRVAGIRYNSHLRARGMQLASRHIWMLDLDLHKYKVHYVWNARKSWGTTIFFLVRGFCTDFCWTFIDATCSNSLSEPLHTTLSLRAWPLWYANFTGQYRIRRNSDQELLTRMIFWYNSYSSVYPIGVIRGELCRKINIQQIVIETPWGQVVCFPSDLGSKVVFTWTRNIVARTTNFCQLFWT